MPTVHTPSANMARVSLVPRPQRRCTAMPMAVPTGRATKASAKMANAISVPSSRDRKGNRVNGKTSTQAIPKTKKSKYSEDRPMITPTAISLGVRSSSVCARERELLSSTRGTGNATEPLLINLLLNLGHGSVLHLGFDRHKYANTDNFEGKALDLCQPFA
ncbi:hypothetical protein SDC9_116593 [bioreactor metagenome]|uniref:Uncharacterized protein n=1 Tax=bioreactor metagenome TaxID=1076179 RepID=A0A645BWL4_9ZZZZ